MKKKKTHVDECEDEKEHEDEKSNEDQDEDVPGDHGPQLICLMRFGKLNQYACGS